MFFGFEEYLFHENYNLYDTCDIHTYRFILSTSTVLILVLVRTQRKKISALAKIFHHPIQSS